MSNITVIDSIMGSGKSTYILNFINNHPNKRYLCVVPTKDKTLEKDGIDKQGEIGRYMSNINFKTYQPLEKPTKSKNLENLLKDGKNIVTTHSLITKSNNEIMNLIKEQGYTLIIDEVLDCVHSYNDNFKKSDFKLLLESGYVHIENDGFLKWNDTKQDFDGKYEQIKNLCNLKSLMTLKKGNGKWSDKIIIWRMPVAFFNSFKECYICTYLFGGSLQSSYFKLNKIKYEHKTIINGTLQEYTRDIELIQRKEKYKLMNIHTFEEVCKKFNKVNNKSFLNKTWYDRAYEEHKVYKKQSKETQKSIKEIFPNEDKFTTTKIEKFIKDKSKNNTSKFEILKNSIYYFKRYIVECGADEFMWTTFKNYRSYLNGKGYSKCFVSLNSKGTNDYRNCKGLAYLINLYPSTDLIHFFDSYGIHVDKDLYALSEMLQWIWRSRIRDNKQIDIYIPSERMRNLLNKWQEGSI